MTQGRGRHLKGDTGGCCESVRHLADKTGVCSPDSWKGCKDIVGRLRGKSHPNSRLANHFSSKINDFAFSFNN